LVDAPASAKLGGQAGLSPVGDLGVAGCSHGCIVR
jgi:hypothetical protein